MAATKRAPIVPGEAPRTQQQARLLADYHEQSEHELGARRGRFLRKWAHATGQASRRASAGMSSDAEEAWMRAEGHRQELADMGVEVPTRTELEAPPAGRTTRAGGASSSGRSTSNRSGSGSPRRSRSSSAPVSRSQVRTVARVTGASGAAKSAGGIAGPILVGTLGIVLLTRLIDEKRGGPQIVTMLAAGVRRLVDLVVLPVDPFSSSSTSAPVVAPAGPVGPVGPTVTAPPGPTGPVSP